MHDVIAHTQFTGLNDFFLNNLGLVFIVFFLLEYFRMSHYDTGSHSFTTECNLTKLFKPLTKWNQQKCQLQQLLECKLHVHITMVSMGGQR